MKAAAGKAVKTVTVRMPLDEASRAEFVARVAETSVNEVFRQALEHYFDGLRNDEDFVARAQALLARDNAIAKQLG